MDGTEMSMLEQVAPPQTAAGLAAELLKLELITAPDLPAERDRALAAQRLAVRLGRRDLYLRATLHLGDVRGREGDTVELGRIAHAVYPEAVQIGDAYLLARSHRQLSVFFYSVGDLANAMAHVVQCMSHTGDDVLPAIRARHLMSLAVVLDETGATEEAAGRFAEALAIAETLGDELMTLTVLNNMTYTAFEQGDRELAERLADRMREIARSHGIPIPASNLDTMARVWMMSGRYAQAENELAPLWDEDSAHLLNVGHAIVEALVTAAEAQREQHAYDRAQRTLDHAVRLCAERDLPGFRAKTREAQALLYAAAGRWQEAFEEFRRFHTETQALQSAQREARAQSLHAVYEADEARRASATFREMAYRDALTTLHNRRYVDEVLPTLLAGPACRVLSVALLDLDHFKTVNDTLSHQAGDRVLQEVATVLLRSVPAAATVARLGGEEFVLLLPGFDAAAGLRTAEAARRAVAEHDWTPITGTLAVTTSVGVTTVTCDGAGTPSATLEAADRHLYEAKRAGRDRVCAGTR
ncbi:GGDEF domain-containing protein [Actinoplanes awajinensis]|nr:GGDEF domain-containing protein [Actinoplanes awajinensis]